MPSGLKIATERSFLSLIFVLYPVLERMTPICSAIDVMLLEIISRVMELISFIVYASLSMTMFRYLSTVAFCPARIKVVLSICSTMAGPLITFPFRRRSLS